MVMRPALFAVVLAAALAAVGVGSYLAVRQNQVPAVAAVTVGEVEPWDAASGGQAPGTPAGSPAAVEATEQIVEVRTPAERTAADRATAARSNPPAPAARAARPAPAAPRAARARTDATDRPLAPTRDAEPGRAPGREPAEAAQAPARSAPPAAAARPPSPRRTSGTTLPRVPGWERVATDARPEGTTPPGDTTRPEDTAWRGEPARPGDTTWRADGASPADATRAADPGRPGGSEPAAPAAWELVLEADSVIGLQVDSFVTTQTAEVEDEVDARVTRDVLAGGEVAIPAGTVVRGSVTLVERAGRVKGRARLGVRFHTVVLDDGVEVPLVTETVYREAGSGGTENAARIGSAAIGGAILGAIFGGRRGAAIGGAAGAGTGAVAALASEGEPATLPYGSTLTIRLARPAVLAAPRQVL